MTSTKCNLVARFNVAPDVRDKVDELRTLMTKSAEPCNASFKATWNADHSAITCSVTASNRKALRDLLEAVGPHFDGIEKYATLVLLEGAGDIPSALKAALSVHGVAFVAL